MNQEISVLIVEDEYVIQLLLEINLRRAGLIICDSVSSGEDAIRSAMHYSPDFILMDIRLTGGMDGIDAARKITQNNRSKIIFISGYETSLLINRTADIHPLAFINKPIDFEELIHLIQSSNNKTHCE